MIECPICKKEFKSLNNHIIWKHNMTVNEFKTKYNITKLQEDCRDTSIIYNCPYCDKSYKYNNQLAIHIKFKHPNYWKEIQLNKELDKQQNYNSYRFTCNLCKVKTNQIYFHICSSHKHDITWEEYCNKFKHNINNKAYFSDKHLKNLSINKTKFYASEKGLQERKRLSIKYSGINNPATRPEVRKKISDAAVKRTLDINSPNTFMENSYGLKFKFSFNNNEYRARSFEEFKVIYTLLKNNIKFEYEKVHLKYKLNNILHTYILDLKINDMYIEIKSNTTKYNYYDMDKYKSIETMLSTINKHLYILTYNNICKMLNINKLTNSEIYKDIKYMLDNNLCFISKYTSNKKHIKSRILQAIDKNYLQHKNIKYIYTNKELKK